MLAKDRVEGDVPEAGDAFGGKDEVNFREKEFGCNVRQGFARQTKVFKICGWEMDEDETQKFNREHLQHGVWGIHK